MKRRLLFAGITLLTAAALVSVGDDSEAQPKKPAAKAPAKKPDLDASAPMQPQGDQAPALKDAGTGKAAQVLDQKTTDGGTRVFRFGEVEIDRVARLVRRQGAEVHLTPTEYRLLTVLAAGAGRVLTQRQLLREVWGPSHVDQGHYLRVYMGHLRQKLESDPAQPRHLLTETAVGYRLVP